VEGQLFSKYKKKSDVSILKSDKGNATVILDTGDYKD
jgi:hypothetical protein